MTVLNDATRRELFDAYALARGKADGPGATDFSTEFRAGDKPVTVVLLPALFVGDWLWEPIWDGLTQAGWPVIRFHQAVSLMDRRTARSINRLAETLLRACRRETPGPLVVCGDSLGALIALELARSHPGDTVGLAVSGAPGLDRAAQRLGRELITGARDAREVADRFLDRLLYEPGEIDPARYAAVVDELATPQRLATMLASLQAIRGYDVPGLLPTLSMPKLFVWGRQDLITPVEPWLDMVSSLPDARLVVIDHCGHAPMFEKPAEFLHELSVLLADCVNRLSSR